MLNLMRGLFLKVIMEYMVRTDRDNEKIYISARSTGEVSVQLIMEKLGGGGHIDIAGAQLEDSTIEEARDLVKRTIKEMEENKEL